MTNTKVRRSGRIPREIPIVLIGSDAEGLVFSEETKTVVLSFHGAGIVSLHKLVAEQELHLRSLESNREVEVRVVGEIGSEGFAHTYGVAFTDPTIDFWQIEFPPPPPSPSANDSPTLSLACSSCGQDIALEQGDYEADVCAIHGGLVRYCAECGLSTMWKRIFPGTSPSIRPAAKTKTKAKSMDFAVAVLEPLPVCVPVSAEPAADETLADRRDRVRAKVNFFASVRTDAFGEDIVRCIDMSRGGVSFNTDNHYREGAIVRIAVPFSQESREASAIFVPAKVIYVRHDASRNAYRCGVAYLPAGSL